MLTSLLKFSMTHGVSESLGGVFPNKVDATLEFRACRVTVVQSPLRGKNKPSDGPVPGNSTLSVVTVSAPYELRTIIIIK